MIFMLCYIVMYYNIDKFLQQVYLPYVAPHQNTELL